MKTMNVDVFQQFRLLEVLALLLTLGLVATHDGGSTGEDHDCGSQTTNAGINAVDGDLGVHEGGLARRGLYTEHANRGGRNLNGGGSGEVGHLILR